MSVPIQFTYNSGRAEDNYGVYANFEEVGMGSSPYPTTKKITTKALWGTQTGELLTFFTSSLQTSASKEYYYEVWGSSSISCDVEDIKMFSVTYGNVNGSGSLLSSGGQAGDTPSRAIYGQYRSLTLETNPTQSDATGAPTTFTLANGKSVEHFYAINFYRGRVGDKLDPGNFELNLAELNGGSHPNNMFTGSNVSISSSNNVISLIDDSADANESFGYVGMPSPVRNLVSGSITNGVYNPSSPHYYGLVYLDQSTILIDADKLNQSSSFNTVTGSNIAGDNSIKLFTSISGSGVFGTGNGFFARSVDVTECSYYYIRVRPSSMNYSNNPTFVSSSSDPNSIVKNTIRNRTFRNDPTVYVSSIGLYNDNLELLAIAKMSKPIRKDYNNELSVTVKLEY
jgi:hypothetical protein